MINSFTVTPSALGVGGGSVTVSWSTTDCVDVMLNGVPVSPSGSITETVSADKAYTLQATPVVKASGSVTVAQPNPDPVDCVLSAWGEWFTNESWSPCVDGMQSRTEMRTRTVVTAPSNGGAPCGPLTETRTVTQACVPPPVGSLPSWVPPSGQVGTIPFTNTPASVMYLTPAGPGSGAGHDYFNNWCSGAYAKDDGALGSMLYNCGGDADYWGTEVYKADFNTLLWSRESERATGLNGQTTSANSDPNFDEVWGEHTHPERSPAVSHNYDCVEYLPPHMGGGAKGSLLHVNRKYCYRYRTYYTPQAFDLASKTWRRTSTNPSLVDFGQHPDTPSWCLDKSRRRYWGIMGGSSGLWGDRINWVEFDTNGIATAGYVWMPTKLTLASPVSVVWRSQDKFVVCGYNTQTQVFGIRTCDLTNSGAGFVDVVLSGQMPDSYSFGLAYCDDLDCFFLRSSVGHRQKVWKVVPSLTGAWTITEIVMPGVTVAPKDTPNGLKKRFAYAASIKCLVWVDDVSGPVYIYRPEGI